MLYLSTLMTLSPYRRHGVAIHLLREMTCRAVDNYGVCSVGAHVWEANVDALEWYRKRGFREVGRESDYYRRLDPSTAIVVQRDVGVMDLV
jgi:ribosomal protein S18 acetylase RimI-like enzyme